MGGSTYDYNGLAYSTRLSNVGPGLNAQWTQEDMLHPRIQGAGVLLPNEKVFLTNGAGAGGNPSLSCVSPYFLPSVSQCVAASNIPSMIFCEICTCMSPLVDRHHYVTAMHFFEI
jgi:hypothetical protein